MTHAHTPGPWRVSKTAQVQIFAEDGSRICVVSEFGRQSETPNAQEDNAYLIARAPDLLAENDRLRAALEQAEAQIAECGEYLESCSADSRVTDNSMATLQSIRAALGGGE